MDTKFEEVSPVVGDIVSLRYKYDSKQIIHTGKILYLSKGHIMLLKEDHDVHLHRCEWIIEKPKTPEEVTREKIEKRLKEIIFYNTTPSSVAMILEEFNITEKEV